MTVGVESLNRFNISLKLEYVDCDKCQVELYDFQICQISMPSK